MSTQAEAVSRPSRTRRPRPAPKSRARLLALTLSGAACTGTRGELAPIRTPTPDTSEQRPTRADPEATSPDELERYLGDRSFRRETLLASLTSDDNHYSKRRIASYARSTGGWDALPEWTPRVRQLRLGEAPLTEGDDVDGAGAGAGAGAGEPWRAIWDGERPTTEEAWIELGRRVFFTYPLRAEEPVEHLLATLRATQDTDAGIAAEYGLRSDRSGMWAGLVEFIDDRGRERVGITCALCHTALIDDEWSVGTARRELNYGQLRLDWYAASDRPLDPEYGRSMAEWGPGRADITDDKTLDPVAIPDLWRLEELGHLTQAGTLRHVSASALAIRQETQILVANGQRSRPPRELMWALSRFLYTLGPPGGRAELETAKGRSAAEQTRGRQLFQDTCVRCHSRPNGSGPLVDAPAVGTDPALASGAARGTGRYRPSPLIKLEDAGPYLHDGTLPSLEALLDPSRLEKSYTGGTRGPGPIPGHTYGMTLTASEKRDLLDYLRSR